MFLPSHTSRATHDISIATTRCHLAPNLGNISYSIPPTAYHMPPPYHGSSASSGLPADCNLCFIWAPLEGVVAGDSYLPVATSQYKIKLFSHSKQTGRGNADKHASSVCFSIPHSVFRGKIGLRCVIIISFLRFSTNETHLPGCTTGGCSGGGVLRRVNMSWASEIVTFEYCYLSFVRERRDQAILCKI